jgi:hypothetical protein
MIKRLFLVILCCFVLAGCSCAGQYNNGYDIIKNENGKWFLKFHDENRVGENENRDGYEIYRLDNVGFSSLSDMREAILEKKLDAFELVHIKMNFPRDAQNRIPIWNLDELYEPVYPEKFQHQAKKIRTWKGTAYTVHSTIVPDQEEIYFFFDESMWLEGELMDWVPVPTPYETTPMLGEADVLQYTYEYDKNVQGIVYRYLIESEGKRMLVYEMYTCAKAENDEKMMQPLAVQVRVEEGDLQYEFWWKGFSEQPTKELLQSFGVQPFVPEEATAA